MKVRVVCYEGYKAEETPRAFLLGERRVEVVRILDRWRGEDHEYVKLDGSDGARYILRYDRSRDEWEIQMMESPGSKPSGGAKFQPRGTVSLPNVSSRGRTE